MKSDNLQIQSKNVSNPGSTERILIFDDEPAIIFSYLKLLQRPEYTLDTCTDLTSAINLLEIYRYKVVITDLRLSGSENWDGINLIEAVQNKQPDTKMIVISGYISSKIKERLATFDHIQYFDKPVHPALIIGALNSSV